MAISILLADPSSHWLNEAAQYLQNHYYEVTKADNGKKAQLAMYNKKFFAIVLNLELQNHSAVQVLKYIRTYQPNLKIILTMQYEIELTKLGLNRKNLEKQGVADFLIQPFGLDQLREALEGHQDISKVVSHGPLREGQTEEIEVEAEDAKFTSIKIDEFISSKAVQFNVFIRLDSGRYVKILHAGDSFSRERIERYKNEKNIQYLYFLTEERKKYIKLGNFLAEKTATNANIGVGVKVNVLKNVSEKIVEEMYFDGLKPQILDQGKAFCNNMYEVIHKNEGLATLLREYQDFDPSAYSHSFLVCLFATSLAKQFEWDSKIVNETIGMATLLHDIGHMKLPKELVSKRPKDMNEEELQMYKRHPEMSVELLAGNTMVSASVRQIIIQHHECVDGTGFPYGLKGPKILTMSKMVLLADEFAHFMVESKVGPPQALKALLGKPGSVARYSSQILENFIKIFIDPGKLPAKT